MKKLSPIQKQRCLRHARNSLKRRLHSAILLKRKRRKLQFKSKAVRKHYREEIEPYKSYKRIPAPAVFSLIENPNKVVDFIADIQDCLSKRKSVYIVLENVEKISLDSITILLSVMRKFEYKLIRFTGDMPKNQTVRDFILESDFFEHLYRIGRSKESDTYKYKGGSKIHTHASKIVDGELASKVIEDASQTVWGETKRCQGVYRTLIELMLNTNNHADSSVKGEKHWWLSVYHNTAESKVCFAFVDYGVGVFTSLNEKREGSKFFGIVSSLRRLFQAKSNAKLMELILNGTMHKTATGKPHRGKGLPGIGKALERLQISNLNIITNDVHAHVDGQVYATLGSSFSGTFIYWELDSEKKCCHVQS